MIPQNQPISLVTMQFSGHFYRKRSVFAFSAQIWSRSGSWTWHNRFISISALDIDDIIPSTNSDNTFQWIVSFGFSHESSAHVSRPWTQNRHSSFLPPFHATLHLSQSSISLNYELLREIYCETYYDIDFWTIFLPYGENGVFDETCPCYIDSYRSALRRSLNLP